MTQYNTTTQQVKIYDETSLVTSLAPNLWEVGQCFSQTTYHQLRTIIDTQPNSFECVALKKRLELTNNSPGQQLISRIGYNMTPSIGALVGHELKFMVSKYWLDLPAFGCQTHKDSEEIFVSYQVYLGSSLKDEIRSAEHKMGNAEFIHYLNTRGSDLMAQGAKFLHVDPPVQIEFKPNHGYLNLNSDLKLHRVDGTWDTRISVMFQYARV